MEITVSSRLDGFSHAVHKINIYVSSYGLSWQFCLIIIDIITIQSIHNIYISKSRWRLYPALTVLLSPKWDEVMEPDLLQPPSHPPIRFVRWCVEEDSMFKIKKCIFIRGFFIIWSWKSIGCIFNLKDNSWTSTYVLTTFTYPQ